MKRVNVLFCWLQIILGVALAAAILFVSSRYSGTLRSSLEQADDMIASVEKQLTVGISVLTDLNSLLSNVGDTIDVHQTTIESALDTTDKLSQTALIWSDESLQFSDIAHDASHIMDTFQDQLPIRLPVVEVDVTQASFDIPTGLDMRSDEARFDYPSAAEVRVRQEGINYPSGADIRTCEIDTPFGDYDYPCGIEIDTDRLEFNVPHSIEIEMDEFAFDVPRIHAPTFERVEFNVPDTVGLEYRELMNDEKELLIETSAQLISTAEAISSTSQSLVDISELLSEEGDIAASLTTVDADLEEAQDTIVNITVNEIPGFVAELESQKATLEKVHVLFSDLQSAIIPLTWIALVFPLMMVLNGIVLLSLARKS